MYRLLFACVCSAILIPMAFGLDLSAPLEGVREMRSTVSSFLGTHRCVHDRQRVWCWGDNEYGQLAQGHTVDLSLATPVPELPTFVQRITSLATGSRHTCAVTDLRLFCWGNNAAGQLGTGDFEHRLRPTEIDLGQPVVGVGAGSQHTCAVDVIDRVFCWGGNDQGQVGVEPDMGTSQPIPVQVGDRLEVEQFALGSGFSCARAAGDIWCWGSNRFGQLGDGTLDSRPGRQRVQGLPAAVDNVAVGLSHACASDDQAVFCWGQNNLAQVGVPSDEEDPESERVSVPVEVQGLGSEVADLALSGNRSCAALGDEVHCWGGFSAGPEPALSWQAPETITALPEEDCAVTGSTVSCVNNTAQGSWASPRLAHRVDGLPRLPLAPAAPPRLTLGANNGCLIYNDDSTGNRLRCWGSNAFGQLGQSDFSPWPFAVEVQPGADAEVFNVGVGASHMCATTPGGLYCWGDNFFNQLGVDDLDESAAPLLSSIPIEPGERVVSNFGYNCLWRPQTSEPLRCWGRVLRGMLEFAPENGSVAQPFEIPVPGILEKVQTGRDHLCIIVDTEKPGREVYCLGDIQTSEDYAEIPTPERWALRQVETGLSEILDLQRAAFTHCALGPDEVVCWGMDHARPEGSRGRKRPPTAVTLPEGFDPAEAGFRFSVGGRHACASNANGETQCIGLPLRFACNFAEATGQIGGGSGLIGCTEEEFFLSDAERDWMKLAALPSSPATALKSGDEYSCALKGGFVHCWGWSRGVPIERLPAKSEQSRLVMRRGAIEPAATLPVALDEMQSCPAFMVARTSLLDPQDESASGAWGAEVLLREGGTKLQGGLNFGGFAKGAEGVPGFAAFRIDNNNEGPQIVRLEMRGDGGQFLIRLETIPPGGGPRQPVLGELRTLTDEPTVVEAQLSEGFHVISLQRVASAPEPALFLVSARTSKLDGTPASFRFGAVVGGYLAPGLSGFAGICTDAAGEVELRTEGQSTRGAKGSGDLRIELENRTSGELIFDSADGD